MTRTLKSVNTQMNGGGNREQQETPNRTFSSKINIFNSTSVHLSPVIHIST